MFLIVLYGRDVALVGIGFGQAGEKDGDDHGDAEGGINLDGKTKTLIEKNNLQRFFISLHWIVLKKDYGVRPVEEIPAHALLIEALAEHPTNRK